MVLEALELAEWREVGVGVVKTNYKTDSYERGWLVEMVEEGASVSMGV